MSDRVTLLEESIRRSLGQHDPRLDSVLFNGGTVLALAASIGATVTPWSGQLEWVPRVLAGLAAFLIGMERALNFGGRWRYHIQQRNAYQSALDRVALARLLPDDQLDASIESIVRDLDTLRRADSEFPSGVTPNAAH